MPSSTAPVTSPPDSLDPARGACPACGASAAPSGDSLGGFALHACPACATRFAPKAFASDVDYDAVYKGAEYVADQVEPISAGVDPETFARIGTYAPFFANVPLRGAGRLLDVGCGAGRFALAAAGRGWSVTGIDVSAEAVRVANARGGFTAKHATLEEALSGGGTWDVITSFEVLEHLRDPREFASIARTGLSSGGAYFVTVPNWDCDEVRTATRADWIPPVHLSFFTQGGLAALLRRAGFSRVTVGFIDGDPRPRGRGLPGWAWRQLRGTPRDPPGLWALAEG